MITFRRAVRESVPLIIGIAGPSGAGKTMSALRLATGMSKGKPFAFLDTEAGRAKHYAEQFAFDHADLRPPFRPSSYAEAIHEADKAGYPVIVVDSCSHEHAGEGGLLDWHEEELDRMTRGNTDKRDNCNMAAWIKPKMDHKQMVSRLLQVRAHLILCFRAEQKIEMAKGADGRMQIQPKKIASGFSDWIPICEKNLLYELTASFLLTPDAPGMPKPIKLQEQMRGFVSLAAPLDEQAGQKMADWAVGGAPATRQAKQDEGDGLEQLLGKSQRARMQAPARQEGGDGTVGCPAPQDHQQGPDAAAPCFTGLFTGLLVSYIAKDPTKRTPHRFTFRIGESSDITVSAYEAPACLKGGEKLVGARFRFSYEEKPNPRNASNPFRNLTYAEIADPPSATPAQKGPIAQAQDEKFAEFKALLEGAPEAEILVDLYTGTVTKEWHGCSPGQRQELSALYSTLKQAFGME